MLITKPRWKMTNPIVMASNDRDKDDILGKEFKRMITTTFKQFCMIEELLEASPYLISTYTSEL